MKVNIPLFTDSYKITHHKMLPKNTETVYSYWEGRTGAKYDETVFVGLQYFLKEYFTGSIVTQEDIEYADMFSKAHFGLDLFNRPMWEHIVNKYGGKLPIRIKAVPEGSVIPISNVMMTVENLGSKITAPLTNDLETVLSQLWFPCTVATQSREAKKVLKDFLDKTADNYNMLPFQLHDFGYRGTSSVESAGIGGLGHLVNFMGTDTIRAMEFAIKYYNADLNDLAYSVPASEHSIMTAKGRAGETEVVRQLLEEYPKGILSIVADSYDVFNFTENIIGGTFKDAILNRDGKVVIRPDSGDPESVTKKLINILGDKFGYTENKKGYKVLNPKVGLIWGDGLSVSDIRAILGNLAIDGWSSENIVMGMGGGLLQKVNRDTQRFAFKCSAQLQGNEWVDIQKDPIHAGKKSKKGRLSLIKQDGVYTTIPYSDNCNDVLETVFENGEIVKEYTFSEIRKNAELK